MSQSLRIAVADDEADTREFLERYLPRLGHQVASVAENGRQLVEQCRLHRPDLIITDVRMPGLDGLDAVQTITAYAEPDWVERARNAGVFAYLVKPVTEKELGPAISLAWLQFEQFQSLRREAADLRQSLEDRKVIERAKGIVTRRLGVPEAEAFRRLRKCASDHNKKLVEVAQQILTAEEVFHALDQ
jgi:AmiR/NasT family two-component response regulator